MRHINFTLFTLTLIIVAFFDFFIISFKRGVPESIEDVKWNCFDLFKQGFFYYTNPNLVIKDNIKFQSFIEDNKKNKKILKYIKKKNESNRMINYFSKGTQFLSIHKKTPIKIYYFI